MIRDATAADRAALRDLHLASWQANYGADLPAAYLRDDLPAEMARKWAAFPFAPPDVILLREGPDGIVGFCRAMADRAVPLIDNLHTHPGQYGQGTGAALLRAMRARLGGMGFARCTLTVLESNERARRFYLREGGEDEGPVHEILVGHPVVARRIGFATT